MLKMDGDKLVTNTIKTAHFDYFVVFFCYLSFFHLPSISIENSQFDNT